MRSWLLVLGYGVWACSGNSTQTTWTTPPAGAAGTAGDAGAPTVDAGAPNFGGVNATGGSESTAGTDSGGGAGDGGGGDEGGTPNGGDGGAAGAAADPCAACAPTQHCVADECLDPVCDPGIRSCRGGDVYECRANGSGERLKANCSAYQFCDPITPACVDRLCTPDAVACDGAKVTTCNALGSGWLEPLDCAARQQGCLDGSCVPIICDPGVARCRGTEIVTCDEHGFTEAPTGYCVDGTHCAPPQGDRADFYCAPDSLSCTPNAKLCVENKAAVCNETGTDHLPSSIDCGQDVCVGGECKPVVCVGFGDCHGSTVVWCNDNGTAYETALECGTGERCIDTATESNGLGCALDACTPSQADCVANRIGTCAASGDTLSKITKDCAASSMVCTAAGTCSVQAVDTFGAGDTLRAVAEGTLIGNVIDTASARLLVELEANLKLPAAREIDFVVLEVIHDSQFRPRFSKTVQAPAGTGWVSSGLIDYELLADRTYLLGYFVSGGPFESRDDQAPWSGAVSFGSVSGSVQSESASLDGATINGKRLFSLRTTTELP